MFTVFVKNIYTFLRVGCKLSKKEKGILYETNIDTVGKQMYI